MTARHVFARLALPAALLWGALIMTHEAADRPKEAIDLFDVAGESFELVYESPSLDVFIKAPEDARWVARTVHRRDAIKPPEEQLFPVDREARALMERALSPLYTTRRWPIEDVDVELFDLTHGATPSDTTLTIRSPRGHETFFLGAEGYGHRHHYAIPEATMDAVVLLDGELVRALSHAPGELLRRHLLDPRDADTAASITLTSTRADKRRSTSLVHHLHPDPLMRYWSYERHRLGRSRIAGRFATALFELRIQAAPTSAQEAWESAPDARSITCVLRTKEGEERTLTLRHTPGAQDPYLARLGDSRYTYALYPGAARDLFERVEGVLDGEASERPLAPPRYEPGDGRAPLHRHTH